MTPEGSVRGGEQRNDGWSERRDTTNITRRQTRYQSMVTGDSPDLRPIGTRQSCSSAIGDNAQLDISLLLDTSRDVDDPFHTMRKQHQKDLS